MLFTGLDLVITDAKEVLVAENGVLGARTIFPEEESGATAQDILEALK
ncbi:MAG: hypothetical protein AB1442_09165 [Nitrospirota bacterium]